MRRYILTGTPGCGKTSLIRTLEMTGASIVAEAATDIIAYKQMQGVAEPWENEDFIDNIKISLEDLEYTNEHGYVKGISNIFTKNLTDMKATQRPIHCSDKKRMQFYIKEKDSWEKDSQNVKINNSIQEITKKQILELKQWEDSHPNYLNNNLQYMEWQKMVQSLMGGETSRAQIKNTESIKKTISQTVDIKEAIEIKV